MTVVVGSPFVAKGTKLYYSLAGYPFADVTTAAAGTWVQITNAKDFSISASTGEADTKNLDSVQDTALPTIPSYTASWTQQVAGKDTSYQAMKAAKAAGTLFSVKVVYSDPSATAGTTLFFGGFLTAFDEDSFEVESVPEAACEFKCNYNLAPVYAT